ncbi:MAG TPA: magnesium transporter, partial [Micromonosporaceae bacterium]|nr:magnesium transporter [Micromonosporaceae bacterium]
EHASSNVPVARPGDRVDELLGSLPGNRFDTASVVAVCEDNRLVGLATIERLYAAPADARLSDVMDPNPPVVRPDTNQEHAAWRAVRHAEPGLAVVDAAGRFQGLVIPHRLLGVLLARHDRDVALRGGFLGSAAAARAAATERVGRRLWHRLPWLLIGLAGAAASAVLVGSFEQQLERQVLLAFFVPGVVYVADAVGTQTEALVIRGLSVGVGVGRIAVRELVTGVLVGSVLAVLVLPAVLLGWGDLNIALAVSVALFSAASVATVIAMALPWAIHKMGKDPAYGAGPLATVIQDLVSIAIYLIAVVVLTT